MTLKRGLKPFRITLKTDRQAAATARILDQLGSAPSASPGYSGNADLIVKGDFGMDGNDQYGDCVFADIAHRIMVRTAQAGQGAIVIPTQAETLALYTEVTGFDPNDPNTDHGGDLVTAAEYMQKTGMLIGGARHTEDGNGIIDPANIDHIKWAICLFGCAPGGWKFPQSGMAQFDAGQPFDIVPSTRVPSSPDHDMLILEYRPDEPSWLLGTWGKRWPATTAFVKACLSEVVPVGAKDFITANGLAPSGVNMPQILQLLSEIN
jgi:hypothetical protein